MLQITEDTDEVIIWTPEGRAKTLLREDFEANETLISNSIIIRKRMGEKYIIADFEGKFKGNDNCERKLDKNLSPATLFILLQHFKEYKRINGANVYEKRIGEERYVISDVVDE